MLSLHVSICTDDGDQDLYKVHAVGDDGMCHDVTDQYDVAALVDESGREGFAVVRRHGAVRKKSILRGGDGPRHPSGVEL